MIQRLIQWLSPTAQELQRYLCRGTHRAQQSARSGRRARLHIARRVEVSVHQRRTLREWWINMDTSSAHPRLWWIMAGTLQALLWCLCDAVCALLRVASHLVSLRQNIYYRGRRCTSRQRKSIENPRAADPRAVLTGLASPDTRFSAQFIVKLW